MSDTNSEPDPDPRLESRLKDLPMELLLQVLHEAFPQDERFNTPGNWETVVQLRRRRELRRIINDAGESLPEMVRRAAQEVYVSCLQPRLVKDFVRELHLLRADPALGRAVRTVMLLDLNFVDANNGGYDGQAMPTDPLWPVYRQTFETLHPEQAGLGFLSLPEWVNRWGVPLTRFLQAAPGISILIVRLEDVASIPVVEFTNKDGETDGNHLSLDNVKTLNLDQFNLFQGGGTLDVGGMLMRSCPHLRTLYLANIDEVVGDGRIPVDGSNNNGESSSTSPPPTRPLLTYLSTLHILRFVRLTPRHLGRLLRMVGPNLQKVVAEIPGSGPNWKTQAMLANAASIEIAAIAGNGENDDDDNNNNNGLDPKESRGYTSREFFSHLLRWTDSLRSLSIKVNYKHEVRVRRRDLHARRGLLVERPKPPTSLLTRFEGLESLEINSVLFWGLMPDAEDGPGSSAIDDAINDNFGGVVANADNADNADDDDDADFDGDIDSDDENDVSNDEGNLVNSLMHFLHTANLSPDGHVVPYGHVVLALPNNNNNNNNNRGNPRVYNPDKYVTDKLASVLPSSLRVLVLHCPFTDGWFGAYACRPAVLGLIRAVREGRFPHLHHIVVDPAMSADDITTIRLSNDRKLVVQAVRADGFVNETVPPREAFAQAMTHLLPEE